MTGMHTLIIQSAHLKFEMVFAQKITIIQGNSATGKTTFVDMLQEYIQSGSDTGITLQCDCPVCVVAGNNWKEQLTTLKNTIVVIDDGNHFIATKEFAEAIRKTDNYYVIITRERLREIPQREKEVYGLCSFGEFRSTAPVFYHMERIYPQIAGMKQNTVLETERLILRPWKETDAEDCYQYAKDPLVGPICGWPPHTDVENSRQVIRNVLAVPETYAIVLKETGRPVGSIGLHFHSDLAENEDEAELGYWLGVPYWGNGIVPEAAKEVLRHAFEDLRLNRVWCGYYDGNTKSKRVQEKLGFKYQWMTDDAPVPQMGETRKGHVNLLTKEEWTSIQTGGQ